MGKEEKVVNYYLICNRLKDIIRTGWTVWRVKRERLESVAEHIFGTQMLAIAMKSEFNYPIDLKKVIMMLAVHELGEARIGDIVTESVSGVNKHDIEHEAVHQILKPLIDGKEIEDLFLEFDLRQSNEAKFAYMCDKLECDLQCKIYDEENCFDLNFVKNNEEILKNEAVKKALINNDTASKAWLKFDQRHNGYDENFNAVLNYLLNHKII